MTMHESNTNSVAPTRREWLLLGHGVLWQGTAMSEGGGCGRGTSEIRSETRRGRGRAEA